MTFSRKTFAVLALQEAAEAYVVGLFEDTHLGASMPSMSPSCQGTFSSHVAFVASARDFFTGQQLLGRRLSNYGLLLKFLKSTKLRPLTFSPFHSFYIF